MDEPDGDQFIEWKEWEHQKNKKFEKIPIHHKDIPIPILSVFVIDGKNIFNNFPTNLVDTPNPQILLEYDAAVGSRMYRTTAKVDMSNPVWNESFTFILPNVSETMEDSGILKIKLVDDSWVFSTPSFGEAELNISQIEFDGEIETKLSFGQATIRLRVGRFIRETPDIRLSHSLSEAEMQFRFKRIPKVLNAFKKTFADDAPRNLFETPVMSLLGSGGGFRAMIGMCGVMEGLEKIGLIDCMTYALGTSGSSWYLTSAYARKAFSQKKRKSYHSWLRKSLQSSAIFEALKISNISKCRRMHKRKSESGQPFTFVDYYGICVANKVVGRKFASSKLSDIKSYVETGDVPYLILNASQVLDLVRAWEYRADCSFSSHELEIPHYGLNVDLTTLNSEYHAGVVGRKLPEPDLSFIIGTLGSAFGVCLNRMLGIEHYADEEILDNAGNPEYFASKEENVETPFWRSVLEWVSHLSSFEDRNVLIDRTGKILSVAKGFKNMKRFSINPEATPEPEEIDGLREADDILSLVDGGILCNVAVDAALRPQRRNDILVICDFSCYPDRVDHSVLEAAMKLTKEGGYKFPPIDFEKLKSEPIKEIYVFEDEKDHECPTVFWFMMSTAKFRKEENYKPRNIKVLEHLKGDERFTDFEVYKPDTDYGTFNVEYSLLEFERLRELMYYNVLTNEKLIKDKISQKIKSKRKAFATPKT